MGRSNPMASTNPTERYFEWDGNNGTIYWYDKEKKEQKKIKPFMFLYLHQLYCITGWNDYNECGIYSNEVADTQKQELLVRLNDGANTEIARGRYSEIKQTVKEKGGKFTASIYLVYMDEFQKPHIGNLKLKGGGLSNWFEFLKEAGDGLINKGVLIHDFTEHTKGQVTYRKPVLKLYDIKAESVEIADQMHEKIEPFIADKGKALEAAEPEPSEDTGQQGPPPNPPTQRTGSENQGQQEGNSSPDGRPTRPADARPAGSGHSGGGDLLDDVDDNLPF